MGDKTAIEWTDATWTPIRARRAAAIQDGRTDRIGWHCEHVSEGCRNCYAEGMNRRLGTGLDYKPGLRRDVELFLDEHMLLRPLRWRKARKIFVCSMTDLFADFVTDEWIDRMFAVMALCPQHVFQVLTKRPERMRDYVTAFEDRPDAFGPALASVVRASGFPKQVGLDAIDDMLWPLPNVWLGTSVEDQQTAYARRDALGETAAAVRFVSYEPALGPVDWAGWEFLNWIISGGESGPNARPSHPDWHRATRDFCAANGIAYLMKQWGEWRPYCSETDDYTKNDPTGEYGENGAHHLLNEGEQPGPENIVIRVGKKAAGRLLDGVLHDGVPE